MGLPKELWHSESQLKQALSDASQLHTFPYNSWQHGDIIMASISQVEMYFVQGHMSNRQLDQMDVSPQLHLLSACCHTPERSLSCLHFRVRETLGHHLLLSETPIRTHRPWLSWLWDAAFPSKTDSWQIVITVEV
jgi:hypothetical protein